MGVGIRVKLRRMVRARGEVTGSEKRRPPPGGPLAGLLQALGQEVALTRGQLARRLGLSLPALEAMLAELQRLGWALPEPCAASALSARTAGGPSVGACPLYPACGLGACSQGSWPPTVRWVLTPEGRAQLASLHR